MSKEEKKEEKKEPYDYLKIRLARLEEKKKKNK